MNNTASPLRVFVCYAREDNKPSTSERGWHDLLLEHLKPLKNRGLIAIFSDAGVGIGEEWERRIESELRECHAAVLLLSPSLLASDYIRTKELPVLIERLQNGQIRLLPIVVRPFAGTSTRFKYPDADSGPHEFDIASLQSACSPSRSLVEMGPGEQDRELSRVAEALAGSAQPSPTKPNVPTLGASGSPWLKWLPLLLLLVLVAGLVSTGSYHDWFRTRIGPKLPAPSTPATNANTSYAMQSVPISNAVPNPGNSSWLGEIARLTSGGEATGNAVKADAQRNIVVVGNFKGAPIFGTVLKTALGASDIFICKFAPAGNMLWVKTFGGTSADNVSAVAIDASGNILITGYFVGTANFGGTNMTSGNGIYGSDIFVAKYSGDGTGMWSKQLGGRYGNNNSAGIAVDSAGNVIVGGDFYTEVDLGNGSLILSRAGGLDGYVAKFAGQTGAYIWGKDFGGIVSDYVKGVVVDSLGNVVVVGYCYASMDFSGGTVTNAGSADLYIVKYAGGDGQYLWSRTAGSSGPDTAEGVAVDKDGNIFVTGGYYYSVDLGGVTLTPPFDTGVYLAKYNPAGILQWARSLGFQTSGGGIGVRGIAVDSVGNVAITGNATGSVDFGSGISTEGDVNFYLAKYGPQGGYLWAKRSINVGWCGGYGVAMDMDRNVISTGSIQGEVNIDGLQASSPGLLIKSAFLIKLAP